MLKKTLLFFALGLVVHLYTTFVLMTLWNWFVTVAFHVGEGDLLFVPVLSLQSGEIAILLTHLIEN